MENTEEEKKIEILDFINPFHLTRNRPRLGLRRLVADPQACLFAKLMNLSVPQFLSAFYFLNRILSMKNRIVNILRGYYTNKMIPNNHFLLPNHALIHSFDNFF